MPVIAAARLSEGIAAEREQLIAVWQQLVPSYDTGENGEIATWARLLRRVYAGDMIALVRARCYNARWAKKT